MHTTSTRSAGIKNRLLSKASSADKLRSVYHSYGEVRRRYALPELDLRLAYEYGYREIETCRSDQLYNNLKELKMFYVYRTLSAMDQHLRSSYRFGAFHTNDTAKIGPILQKFLGHAIRQRVLTTYFFKESLKRDTKILTYALRYDPPTRVKEIRRRRSVGSWRSSKCRSSGIVRRNFNGSGLIGSRTILRMMNRRSTTNCKVVL